MTLEFSLIGGAKEAIKVPENEAIKAALQVEEAFSQVIESAKPTVVVITNKQTPKMGRRAFDGGNPMDMLPEEWYEFFGLPRRGERGPKGRPRRERERPQAVGKGSGVFIQGNGLILTNHHVIKDCDYLEVKTADATVYDNEQDKNAVTIVGYDEEKMEQVTRSIANRELRGVTLWGGLIGFGVGFVGSLLVHALHL